MSDPNGSGPNRTVFRPSPLERRDAEAPAAAAALSGVTLPADDVPAPLDGFNARNPLMVAASPLLALIASVRAGRAQIPLPELHQKASQAIEAFQAQFKGRLSEEDLRRAIYAISATADDVALNLPGQEADAGIWAQRNLVVRYFHEAIGGDRFWLLLNEMMAQPASYQDLLELYHACMASGFEGRFRVTSDGRRAHQELMQKVLRTLEATKGLSQLELVPHWRGADAPAEKVGMWMPVALAGAAALTLLLLVYLVLRLILSQTGAPALTALQNLYPQSPLRLSRSAPATAPPSDAQAQRIRAFLAAEIAQGLVQVIEDPTTVRVRTTVGQLFQSGSDRLDPARRGLIDRIGLALNEEPGPVRIEGYTDSDRPRGPTFPDNLSLSQARAETVAALVRQQLSDPRRVSAQGFAETQPIAANTTPDGKAQNRRVEVVVDRRGS